jgi:mannose-6-phosphate isomerase-like protein (cupin superfamily)
MKSIVLATIFLILPCAAQAPQGYAYFSAAQLKGYEKKLAPKIDEKKVAGEQLGRFGNHTFQVTHRQGSGESEVHDNQDDIFIVQSGSATLIIGGKVIGGKSTGPGEIRGTSIEGGMRQRLGPGDVVNIPAQMPHQVVFEGGRQFTYMIVKVDAR